MLSPYFLHNFFYNLVKFIKFQLWPPSKQNTNSAFECIIKYFTSSIHNLKFWRAKSHKDKHLRPKSKKCKYVVKCQMIKATRTRSHKNDLFCR